MKKLIATLLVLGTGLALISAEFSSVSAQMALLEKTIVQVSASFRFKRNRYSSKKLGSLGF